MKKIYLTLILLSAAFLGANAQSFTATNIHFTGDPMYFVEGHATINNISSTAKDVYVQRVVNNTFAGHTSYFCWAGECYASSVNISLDYFNIPPGGNTDLFRGDLETNLISGVSVVSYCFYDGSNPSDSVCVEYTYPTFVGLNDAQANKNFISKAFPNPAADYTNFYVSVEKSVKSAQLKIFNMLGSNVKTVDVLNSKNSVRINTSDLKSGIYFYSLWIDGKSTTTGKLMVSRN